MLILNNINTIPPGGWQYEQKNADGSIAFRISTMNPFSDAVHQLITIRKSNGMAGANINDAATDLHAYQCARLQGYCHDTTANPIAANPTPPRGCGSCGRAAYQH